MHEGQDAPTSAPPMLLEHEEEEATFSSLVLLFLYSFHWVSESSLIDWTFHGNFSEQYKGDLASPLQWQSLKTLHINTSDPPLKL